DNASDTSSDAVTTTLVNDGPELTLESMVAVVEDSASAGDTVATYSASDEDAADLTCSNELTKPYCYYAISNDMVTMTPASFDNVKAANAPPIPYTTLFRSDNASDTSSDAVTTTLVNDGPELTLESMVAVVEDSASAGDTVATYS